VNVNGASHRLVQVPPGVQCFVGEEARRRRALEETVLEVFAGWDYEEIIPPLFDYADVFSSPDLAARTYSFVGRDGSLLALRPDFTSLLAKVAAGRLAHRTPPIRLCYSGEVLRYEPPKAGRQSELHQVGLEHLGGSRRGADAEILAVAAECLERLGVRGWVLALGHVGVFHGLVTEARLDPGAVATLRERVEAKDADGVRALLGGQPGAGGIRDAVVRLCGLSGPVSVLEEAAGAFAPFAAARAAVEELAQTARALTAAGLAPHLAIDLGEVRGLEYYTGLVFRVYAEGLGFEIGGGGRYDTLLGRFGRPLPAVGFMFGLDRLDLLMERQGVESPATGPVAERVTGDDVGAALARARERRARGARVRFEGGAS
jgi:ATP phosphoribosyltransferase regulatory subunit